MLLHDDDIEGMHPSLDGGPLQCRVGFTTWVIEDEVRRTYPRVQYLHTVGSFSIQVVDDGKSADGKPWKATITFPEGTLGSLTLSNERSASKATLKAEERAKYELDKRLNSGMLSPTA